MDKKLTDVIQSILQIQTDFIISKTSQFQLHKTPEDVITYRQQIKIQDRKYMQQISRQYLMRDTSQLAIVLMAGGHSARFTDQQYRPKQIAVERLFSRFNQTIDYFMKKQWNAIIYVVCSLRNIQAFYQELQKKNAQKYRIYLCKHHQINVFDQFGQPTFTDQFNNKLMYPSGVGNILQSQIQFGPGQKKTIREHMEKQNIQFTYCYGCANILQKGVDLILLSQLLQNEDKDFIFKCTQANTPDQSLARVLMKSTKRQRQPQWQVIEYENEQFNKISANQKNLKQLQKSKVWMNNFVFRFQKYNDNYKKRTKESGDYQFLKRKIINQKDQSINCIIAEKKISSSFMKGMNCYGIEQNRQSYLPIITKQDKKLVQQKSEQISNLLSKKFSIMSMPSRKMSLLQSKKSGLENYKKKTSLNFFKK